MESIIKIALLLPAMFLSAAWSGYVLSVLWRWFIVPALHVDPLRIPYAIGLSIVVGLLTHQVPKESPDTATVLCVAFILPAFALLYGWVVTLFL